MKILLAFIACILVSFIMGRIRAYLLNYTNKKNRDK